MENSPALAEAEFDVLLTVDQTFKYQQKIRAFNIGVRLLVARNNRLKTMLSLMPKAREAVENIEAGRLFRIGGGQQLLRPNPPQLSSHQD